MESAGAYDGRAQDIEFCVLRVVYMAHGVWDARKSLAFFEVCHAFTQF